MDKGHDPQNGLVAADFSDVVDYVPMFFCIYYEFKNSSTIDVWLSVGARLGSDKKSVGTLST